jgi:outer membrane protein assembly factor BamB
MLANDGPTLLHDIWAIEQPKIDDWRLCGDRIVACAQRNLFCLDLYTGRTQLVPNVFPHRLDADDGDTLIAYAAGIVYYFDGATLKARSATVYSKAVSWEAGPFPNASSLEVTDGVCIVTALSIQGDTVVTGVSAREGSTLWTAPVGGSPGPIALTQGAVFFVANNRLQAVNVKSGNSRAAGAALPRSTSVLNQTDAPICAGDTIVCGGDAVYAFSARDGSPLWTALASSAAPAVTVGRIDDATVVASGGGVVARINVSDGSIRWNVAADAVGEPYVIGDTVYLRKRGAASLLALSLASGMLRGEFATGCAAPDRSPLVGNGWLFVPTADGTLHATPFATENAAFFDGTGACVEIAPSTDEFDFGLADFSVEAWVHSSVGGELVSSYPASPGHCGFRLNLGASGAVQFAVIGAGGDDADLWATGPTDAADGYWHHVAAVRSRGEMSLYVDGLARKAARAYHRGGRVVNPYHIGVSAPPLAVAGKTTLVIGAFKAAPGAALAQAFTGMMREVRIWSRAIDADKIASRMTRRLDFCTADLLGNFHLDQDYGAGTATTPQPVENDVPGGLPAGSFVAARSYVSDVPIDESDYPFALEKPALAWPYDSTQHWAVRGLEAISSAPAFGGKTVAFGDGRAVYGVQTFGGARAWSVGTPEGASAPVAAGDRFFVLTGQEGLITIGAATGDYQTVPGFGPPQGARSPGVFCPPAVSPDYIAAAWPDGTVLIAPLNGGTLVTVKVGAAPAALAIAGVTLAVFAADTLYGVDASSGAVRGGLNCQSPAFYLDAKRLLCVQDGAVLSFDPAGMLAKPDRRSETLAGAVVGMQAWSDANLLIVTTDSGSVYGLSLTTLLTKWQHAFIGQRLNAPTIDDGNVILSTQGGLVVALDALSGDTLAQYQESSGILTPAISAHGVLYYGCADGAHTAPRDGALHSVALGTTVALGCGPLREGEQQSYATIPAASGTLRLPIADRFTLEAWVNTREGGEIVSVLPGTDDPQSFYTRLALDPSGAIAFEFATHLGGGSQSVLMTTPATVACEGKWHHLAVTVCGIDFVRIYLDGQAQAATSAAVPQPVTATGQVLIGAGRIDRHGTPAAFFTGLVAEIRLWDTYLVAAEIAERMHVALRGDEPDLRAYWNFSARSVYDASRNGLDGVSAGSPGGAYWLTNLPLEAPAYPFLTTAGSIASDDTDKIIFKLAISAFKADATGLATPLTLWYVRYSGSSEPATIDLVTDDGTVTLTGVAPEHEFDPQAGVTVNTSAGGTVVVQLISADRDHGPSLDLRAPFMNDNERYHVNVLIDTQTLSRPAPPALIFQTALMEDYAYVPGDPITSSSLLHTFRTIITTQEADGRPRPFEALQIWAEAPLTIDVNGVALPISPFNATSLATDAKGQLQLVVKATDISSPELLVWAGFMQRDARVKVPVDQPVRTGLARVQGGELNANKTLGWRPQKEGGPRTGAVLNGDYTDHSDEIAQTMRHVMASGLSANTPQGANLIAAVRPRTAAAAGQRRFVDMRARKPTIAADRVAGLRTLRHIQRRMPVTPEFVLASLRAVNPKSLGFRFTCTDGDIRTFVFEHITDPAEVAKLRQTIASHPAQGRPHPEDFFSDMWDGIKDAGETIYDGAKSLVVTIGDTVESAIETAEDWVRTAINDIRDAFVALANFIEKLALEVIAIIEFLLGFFDFGEIIATAHRLLTYFKDGLEGSQAYIRKHAELDTIGGIAIDWLSSLDSKIASLAGKLPTTSVADMQAQYQAPGATEGSSVSSGYVAAKVAQYAPPLTLPSPAQQSVDDLEADLDRIAVGIGEAIYDLVSALPDVASMSADQLLHVVATALHDVVSPIIKLFQDLVRDLVATLDGFFSAVSDSLDDGVEIPCISEFYEWITGDDLTIGDLMALVIAIPTNIIYRTVTGGSKFSDGPEHMTELFSEAPRASRLTADSDGGWSTACAVLGILSGVATALSDAENIQTRSNRVAPVVPPAPAAPLPGWDPKGQDYATCVGGLLAGANILCHTESPLWTRVTGMTACTVLSFCFLYRKISPPGFLGKVADKLLPIGSTLVGIGLIVDGFLEGDLTDWQKAENFLWRFPMACRVALYIPPNPYVKGAMIANDVACAAAAAAIHLTKG